MVLMNVCFWFGRSILFLQVYFLFLVNLANFTFQFQQSSPRIKQTALFLCFIFYLYWHILFMSSRKIWTNKEDQVFRRIADQYQPKNWALIAKRLSKQFGFKKRTGKQCRERWYNHLDPQISKKAWSKTEQQRLLSLHKIHGNKWTLIAEEMTGRSDNSIKNYFYSTVRRNLRRMGKYCGSKNSTGLMREIKPSTMTRIFGSLNEQFNQNIYRNLETEGLTKNFLKQSCENIREEIIKFSSFKPKKNDKISEQQKRKYEQVFWLIKKVNEIYEKLKIEQKSNQTQKQLFRHYYQEMNKQSSEEEVEEESQMEEEFDESQREQKPVKYNKNEQFNIQTQDLRTSKKVQVISLSKPLSAQSINLMGLSGQQSQQKPIQTNQQSSNLNRNALESTLENIVEYAQQIQFNDPQFEIQIGEQRQKLAQSQNPQIQMSNMSFKSQGFGTPVSQVNFFKSPKSTKISCLNDYLMRMSNSYKEQFNLGSSGEVKEVAKQIIPRKNF